MRTFEQYLMDRCPSHTNNSPEGFERWMENLDVQEVIDYAESWGRLQVIESRLETLKECKELINK